MPLFPYKRFLNGFKMVFMGIVENFVYYRELKVEKLKVEGWEENCKIKVNLLMLLLCIENNIWKYERNFVS